MKSIRTIPEENFTNTSSVITKARETIILAENKKLIDDEVKPGKDNEAKFMYEEHKVVERLEAESQEKEKEMQQRIEK